METFEKESQIGESLIETKQEYYYLLQKYTVGPQAEGLLPKELDESLLDESTEFLDLNNQECEKSLKLPFLVNIKHAKWFNLEFFKDKSRPNVKLFYSALPQAFLGEFDQCDIDNKLKDIKDKYGNFDVVYDYPDFVSPILTSQNSNELLTPEKIPTQAAIFHYETVVRPVDEKLNMFEKMENVKELDRISIIKSYKRIWNIYISQFKKLVDAHPISGAFSFKELKNQLLDEDTTLMVFEKDNEIISFGYYMNDIKKCDWINPEYYTKKDGLKVVYMPGIASDPEASTPSATPLMAALLHKALSEHGDFRVTFECSNKSNTYIPKLSRRMFDRIDFATYSGLNEVDHKYKLLYF